MTLAIISVAASLALVLVLNWKRFNALGATAVTRMLFAWTAVILGLAVLVRFLGLA